ncbi:MAG TPA: hypothetical protein VN037_01950 [Verrucomicrobiae bacterium]|nr:hypothetical protein [Verrucomicrobiae bacterium]
MRLKAGIIALVALIYFYPTSARAADPIPVGRWEIVHTTGDNTAQSAYGPGNFSTFLRPDGTGYTYGTFSDSSLCVRDSETFNQVPSWIQLGANTYQITIAVNNLGQGPNFSFIYTGVFSATTSVPGSSGLSIPAITGTYYAVGDASACSITTIDSPGNFVATFLPTISDGSAAGSLDAYSADNGSAFDSTVNTTITFSTPPALGQLAGTVALSPDPTFHLNPCFAATNGVTDPLTLNSGKSSQSGIFEYMFADGLDPYGVPTTLFLNSFSANLYVTGTNTDPTAAQITTTEWAVSAAIGEDNPNAGPTGVNSDGTNSTMVMFYGVIGGVCSGAGGVDAPFHFKSGNPVSHWPKPIWHHRNRAPHNQSQGKFEQHQPGQSL